MGGLIPYYFLLTALVVFYILLAPYSKIEESFNTQAVHDILFIGLGASDIDKYDNTEYPCVVPRTFIGSLFVSAVTFPLRLIFSVVNRQSWQLITRMVLASANVLAISWFTSSLSSVKARKWFLVFTAGQFHIVFYISRMLPNIFALPLVLMAYTLVQKKLPVAGLSILTVSGIVFRGELAALVVPLSISLLLVEKVSLWKIVKAGILGVTIGTALTVLIDSYFWQQWTFPELEGFIFNVVEGKASDWGTEPWWTYFAVHVPNALANPVIYLLALVGLKVAPGPLRALGLAAFGFLALYSLQPHKELRFVIYIVPVLSALAAEAIGKLRFKNRNSRLVICVTALGALAAIAVSLLKVIISSHNYPGGEALRVFHEIVPLSQAVNKTVHIDVLGFRTGHTRFGEEWRDMGVNYHRTEDENVSIESLWPTFDFYIGELAQTDLVPGPEAWERLATIQAFDRISLAPVISTVRSFVTDPIAMLPLITQSDFYSTLYHQVVLTSDSLHIYERIPGI